MVNLEIHFINIYFLPPIKILCAFHNNIPYFSLRFSSSKENEIYNCSNL